MPKLPKKSSPKASSLAILGSGLALLSLSACAEKNQLVVDSGVGVASTLSACPNTAIPEHTGDVTIFNPANSRDASAIDVVATITNVRPTCDETGAEIYATASFDVQARRSDNRGQRTVTLPYFSTVVRGGNTVVAKRLGSVTLNFADGAYRAETKATGAGYIDKAAATLPEDIRERITRRRKSGDADAAIDPLSVPEVRTALQRTSFELLVGFQLTQDQLQYNATR
ncbi:hypothetical protein [Blastomonas sp.]|uniref:hypothetical protein n=1 Tax=Blastomonas sp. TaxID=1909299 RepID=UPI0026131B90|nr:hypothetical protein [Blastomonas sp.]MDM7955022.1 hypothetical protein [Blastomonas sp.]